MRISVLLAGTTFVALAAVSLGASAQVMKCVGKDGHVEFANSCPPGTNASSTGVSSRPAPAAPAAAAKDAKDAAPKSLSDRDADFRKRQNDQKEAAAKSDKEAADKAQRAQACQNARTNMQTAQSRQRMYRTDPQTGERIAYEEEDFQREEQSSQRAMAEACK